MSLSIEPIKDRPESEGLALLGILDLASRGAVLAEVGAALQGSAATEFVLRLDALTFVDSSGLSALVELSNQARSTGKTMIMAEPTAALDSLLGLTALDQVFVIERGGQRSVPQIVTADPG